MPFVAISQNTGDPLPHLDEETRRTAELQRDGTISALWVKADFSGAILVLQVADREAADAALATLPLVERGIARFELIEVIDLPPG